MGWRAPFLSLLALSTPVHLCLTAKGLASFAVPGLGCIHLQVRVMVGAAAAGTAGTIHHGHSGQALLIHRVPSYPHHRLRVGVMIPTEQWGEVGSDVPKVTQL